MSKKMKDFSEDFNLEEAGDSARDSIDSLQQKARKKYDKLVKEMGKGRPYLRRLPEKTGRTECLGNRTDERH